MTDDRRAALDAFETLKNLYPPSATSSSKEAADLAQAVTFLDEDLAGHLHSLGTTGALAPHMREHARAVLAWDPALAERARRLASSSDPAEAHDGAEIVGYLDEIRGLTNVARRLVGLPEVPDSPG
jgi:hypothetical protein